MSSTSIEGALAALLGRVWPSLPAVIARAEQIGFTWTSVSTPFVRREGDVIPPLDALVRAVGARPGRIVALFAPDRLGDGSRPEPWDARRAAAHGDAGFAGLMARGPLDVGDALFMLPPLART